MIIVGAYPDGFETAEDAGGLEALGVILGRFLPPSIGLHILPVGPAAGDSGFACNDWFQVREDLGTWADLSALAARWKVIIDGIYNHVGLGHRFAREFFSAPDARDNVVHAFSSDEEPEIPRSPRGGCALRGYMIDGRRWLVWQTFSEYAIDIQLDHPRVQEEIDRHLDFVADLGVWGLRLDGPAYYGKQVGIPNHRHHPDAYRLSRLVADKALRRGLAVNAQLDCDTSGLEYFPRNLGYDVPIVDFSYSAYLVHALLRESTEEFARHLQATWQMPQTLIRCPRTFDGILMRSKNLEDSVFDDLVQLAKDFALPLRVIDGRPYEINSSFPYVCSLGVRPEQARHRIEVSIAVTAFMPGRCYIYLPLLFGYMPESYTEIAGDPRLLNRHPVPASVQEAFLSSEDHMTTQSLLEWLARFGDEFGEQEEYSVDSVASLDSGVLRIRRHTARMLLLANFSHEHRADVRSEVSGVCLEGRRCQGSVLDPLGFGIWHY